MAVIRDFFRERPEPGYARYSQVVDLDRTLLDGFTPYQGSLVWETHTMLRACHKRFSILFEYVKMNELGVAEVIEWCTEQFGRQWMHDRNSERQNEKARWWLVDDYRIAFSDPVDATAFKLKWS